MPFIQFYFLFINYNVEEKHHSKGCIRQALIKRQNNEYQLALILFPFVFRSSNSLVTCVISEYVHIIHFGWSQWLCSRVSHFVQSSLIILSKKYVILIYKTITSPKFQSFPAPGAEFLMSKPFFRHPYLWPGIIYVTMGTVSILP